MISKKMMGAGLAAGLGSLYMANNRKQKRKQEIEESGTSKVFMDDPWSDGIYIPYLNVNNKPIMGEAANAWNIYEGLEDILYRGHTGQKINKENYNPQDVQKAIKWYEEAAINTNQRMKNYANNPAVMEAQNRRMKEISSVLEQLIKG